MAVTASKSEAYSCRTDNETVERCSLGDPIIKLTPEDIETLRAGLLAEQLDAEVVDKYVNDVFLKYTSDQSWEEMYKTSVRINQNWKIFSSPYTK